MSASVMCRCGPSKACRTLKAFSVEPMNSGERRSAFAGLALPGLALLGSALPALALPGWVFAARPFPVFRLAVGMGIPLLFLLTARQPLLSRGARDRRFEQRE